MKMHSSLYYDQISADIQTIDSILRRHGVKWLCQTLSNICLDHEMDAIDFSPTEIAWMERRKAFTVLARKMDKIYHDSMRSQIAQNFKEAGK